MTILMMIFDDNFDDIFWWQFLITFLMTIFYDTFWWHILMTICYDNFWWQLLMTIFDDNFFMTIYDNFWCLFSWQILTILTDFWKTFKICRKFSDFQKVFRFPIVRMANSMLIRVRGTKPYKCNFSKPGFKIQVFSIQTFPFVPSMTADVSCSRWRGEGSYCKNHRRWVQISFFLSEMFNSIRSENTVSECHCEKSGTFS